MIRHGYSEIEWELKKEKEGFPYNLFIGGKRIHSSYSPEKQASEFAKITIEELQYHSNDLLILIGSGLGYLPNALLQQGLENVIIYNPFPKMREHVPYIYENWRYKYPIFYAFQMMEYYIRTEKKDCSRPTLRIHPGYKPFTRMEYKLIYYYLKHICRGNSEYNLQNIVISPRSLENLALLPSLPSIDNFLDKYEGHKGIFISPGPSLKAALPYLKKRKEGILFCSLQALPLLQKNNIEVDFVVVADPNDLSKFSNESTKNFGAILIDSSAAPSTLQWAPEKTFLYHIENDQLHRLLWDKQSPSFIKAPLSTVSETSIVLGHKFGIKDYLIIGMDFCWKTDRYSYRPKAQFKAPSNSIYFDVETINGEPGTTDVDYFHAFRYLDYFICNFPKSKMNFFQYTEGLKLNSYVHQISAEQIEAILCSYKEKPSIDFKHPELQSQVNLAKELLQKASSSQYSTGRLGIKSSKLTPNQQKNYLNEVPLTQQQVYFDEIPINSRQEACLKALKCLENKYKTAL